MRGQSGPKISFVFPLHQLKVIKINKRCTRTGNRMFKFNPVTQNREVKKKKKVKAVTDGKSLPHCDLERHTLSSTDVLSLKI